VQTAFVFHFHCSVTFHMCVGFQKKDKQYTEGEEETQRSGGKTKPKPADDTMKFVSESSDEGEVRMCSVCSQCSLV